MKVTITDSNGKEKVFDNVLKQTADFLARISKEEGWSCVIE